MRHKKAFPCLFLLRPGPLILWRATDLSASGGFVRLRFHLETVNEKTNYILKTLLILSKVPFVLLILPSSSLIIGQSSSPLDPFLPPSLRLP